MTNAMDPRCLFGKPDPLVAICRSLLKKLSKSWGVACLNKWFQSQFLVRKGNWWYIWLECSGCTWLYTMWGAEHLDNLQPDFRCKWPNIRQPFGIQVTIEVRKWFKVTLASESNKTSVSGTVWNWGIPTRWQLQPDKNEILNYGILGVPVFSGTQLIG